jgi:hypothetical protein
MHNSYYDEQQIYLQKFSTTMSGRKSGDRARTAHLGSLKITGEAIPGTDWRETRSEAGGGE